MSDQPLSKHPVSGEAIRRVILGGYGVLNSAQKKSSAPARGGCCGGGPRCCG